MLRAWRVKKVRLRPQGPQGRRASGAMRRTVELTCGTDAGLVPTSFFKNCPHQPLHMHAIMQRDISVQKRVVAVQ